MTSYALIKRLNKVLTELGIDKQLPTQMGYTYAKKGMINGVTNAKTFSEAEADAFIAKYLLRNGYVQAEESVATESE